MNQNQQVVSHHGGRTVRAEHNARVASRRDTQEEAIGAGRAIARHQQSELVFHGRDGRIRHKDPRCRALYPPAG